MFFRAFSQCFRTFAQISVILGRFWAVIGDVDNTGEITQKENRTTGK
jgi:hypothetical protein